jgi:Heterokaryon incompatibility protein (HET)
MLRDVDLALGDISLNLNALYPDSGPGPGGLLRLLLKIGEIQDGAVQRVEAQSQASQRLRLISSYTYNDPNSPTRLFISGPDDHPGETNYLAVSYCWDSFGSEHEIELPQHFLMVTTKGTRKPRCPRSVLSRAVRYAQSKGIPYIWIDQECIEQDDSTDKEYYIRCMHEIFSQSRHTIGLLTTIFTSQNWLADLYLLSQPNTPIVIKPTAIRRMARHLRSISRDRWFSRTWTLQEKKSAQHMKLLIPHDPRLTSYWEVRDLPGEIMVSLIDLYRGIKRWSNLLGQQDHDIARAIAEVATTLTDMLGFQAISFVSPDPGSNEIWPFADQSFWRKPLWCRTFIEIERCDNRIASDRLSILSNICKFQQRLNLQVTLQRTNSYSLCVLALLLNNACIPALRSVSIEEAQSSAQDMRNNVIVLPPMHLTIGQILDGIEMIEEGQDSICQQDQVVQYCRRYWPENLSDGAYRWRNKLRFSTKFIEEHLAAEEPEVIKQARPEEYQDVIHALQDDDAAAIAFHVTHERDDAIERVRESIIRRYGDSPYLQGVVEDWQEVLRMMLLEDLDSSMGRAASEGCNDINHSEQNSNPPNRTDVDPRIIEFGADLFQDMYRQS